MQRFKIHSILRNKLILLLCCCLGLASCEDPNDLGLGLVDDNISGIYTDTLTVNVSTVYLDSMVTSGTNNMLIGQYAAPYTGTTEASTFFQVGLPATWTVAEDATFDSLKLILPYSDYNYGDTTNAQTFEVYRLTSDITQRRLSPYFFSEEPLSYFYTEPALYNNSNIGASEEALGSFTFSPRPIGEDSIAIPLSAELGEEWLSLKKAADSRLTDGTNFISYFKGLKVASTAGTSVLGFTANTAEARLYYTETVNGALVSQFKSFPLTNAALQYNQILANLEGTELEGVVRSGEAVAASQTGNVSVAQGGSGLIIKLDFPYLNSLKEQLSPDLINRVVLVVEPLSSASYPYPVPQTLGLYRTNNTNVPLAPVTVEYDINGTELTAAYAAANDQGQGNRYEFNLTQFFISRLKEENKSSASLMLAPPRTANTQGVSRLIVGGPGNQVKSVKLKVYYTTIK
jgi:hypothetical protein